MSINELRLTNSTILYGDETNVSTFKNVNALLQKKQNNLEINLQAILNQKNQRIPIDLSAELNLTQAPTKFELDLKSLKADFTGTQFVQDHLKMKLNGLIEIKTKPLNFKTNDLLMTLNDQKTQLNFDLGQNNLSDSASKWLLTGQIQSPKWDFNAIFKSNPSIANKSNSTQTAQQAASIKTESQKNPTSLLNNLDFNLMLKVDQMNWQNFELNSVQVNLENKNSLLQLTEGQFHLEQGLTQFSGQLDMQADQLPFKINGALSHFELSDLSKFTQDQSNTKITGKLNGEFDLIGRFASSSSISSTLDGRVNLELAQLNLRKTEIATQFNQQFISQLEKLKKGITSSINWDSFTQIKSATARIKIKNNMVYFESLSILSSAFKLNGSGNLNLQTQQVSLDLGFQLLGALNQSNPIVNLLNTITIPLKVTGTTQNTNYTLNTQQILNDLRKKEIKNKLQNLLHYF